jgi:glutamate synthase domain-containing protein 2
MHSVQHVSGCYPARRSGQTHRIISEKSRTGKIPIVVKLGPGRVKDDVQLVAEAGADILSVDGYGRRYWGRTRSSLLEHTGFPPWQH